MTIVDSSTLSPGAVQAADVCIIGAGAAGITVALGLIDSGLSVLLVESGGFDLSAQTQDLYRGTMSGIDTWRPDDHRWRYFGGSTNRWAGWCMPLSAEDFEPRDYIPRSGWPIRLSDLEPYYERAQELVEIGGEWDATRLAEGLGRALLPSPGGRLTTRIFRYSPPTRFGSRYRSALAAAERVTVLLNANLTEIVLGPAGSSVSHLACATLDGSTFAIEAGRYVLAMGGLENARVLLASRGRSAEGVGNGSGLVGRCFMEHPHLTESAAWLELGEGDRSFYEDYTSTAANDRVRAAMALSREVREAEGLPDLTITMHEEELTSAPTGAIAASSLASLWRGRGPARLLRLTLRAEQTPFEESRVTLTDELDPLGMPRLDVRWRVRDEDLVAYRRATEILGRELGAAGAGRIWTPRDAAGRFEDVIHPGGHHMGTTRMSADPSDGVVDASCRCHEVDDLYIAGSSVFTTSGSANPTLTVVALAARLADHLAEVAS